MLTAISICLVAICIFLVGFVLVQNPKGGGLTQNLASTQQVMGVRKTTDFLTKGTWFCAIAIMILSFISVAVLPTHVAASSNSMVDEIIKNQATTTPAATAFPTPAAEDAPAAEVPAPAEAPAE